MARSKKTRKVGPIGVPKSPVSKPASGNTTSVRGKKKKGNAAGSRHSQPQQTSSVAQDKGNKDPRHGSKKAVPLVVKQTPSRAKPSGERFFSPRQELKAIENDDRLYALIDLVEEDGQLSDEDQQYVDQKLERHRILCDLLGIQPENDAQPEAETSEEDLLDKFDTASLSAFKP